MLKRIAKKLLTVAVDRPPPPEGSEERAFLAELHAAFRDLPVLESANAPPSEGEWLGNMNRLRELSLTQDPRRFLRWDVIGSTMFIDSAHFVATELRYLKQRPDWNTRWRGAIKESAVGNPVPYVLYPASSGNLIHHAFHVARFEETTKAQVSEMDFVFEFGGGYGSMCRLFHNLGFRGKYVIYDLPGFSALQTYFLKTLRLPVRSLSRFAEPGGGILCLSDIQQLKRMLSRGLEPTRRMCLATWSLSESPLSVRELILPHMSEFEFFLIAYQDRFGEVDNRDFFGNLAKTVTNVCWRSCGIEHIPGNNYLFGRADARP